MTSTSTSGTAPTTGTAAAVEVEQVTRRYGRGDQAVTALGPVDLRIDTGEFLVLVGASGCGKSTLLRLIAGFEEPSTGRVTVAGAAPEPGRGAGLVFQQPRLLPWRTVGSNVDLALRYAGLAASERVARRDALLHRVGLDGIAHRRIWEISGGQQQRVAIARALAVDSQLLLLDEPFAALDALTRERLQEDLRQVSAETHRTSVFVTHSVDEAVFLGSRVIVLSKRPGQIALDLPVDLPRTGATPDEIRALPAYATARSTVAHAVRAAAA
ncbi:ABC transporter ATP-binding protein [uncultured Friedmanniella sp.]|uniref:ABC transporter ATP-binding protein n=1 Tax=uncultured Friedmanniella sp. TaxID=335381 RepID=UPI0035CAC4A8